MTFGGSRTDRDAADARALASVQQGDTHAISELYDRYASTAMGVAMKILRSTEEAEDTVHDAFMAVVERAHQYHPERGTVAAWLLTTVRNLAVDRTRRTSRRAQIVESDFKHEAERAGVDESPEARLSVEHERDAVRRALATLPEAQQRTLIVAFFEGLSYPEIAERDAIALGTIKSRAARAIHALRALLDDGSGVRQDVEPDREER